MYTSLLSNPQKPAIKHSPDRTKAWSPIIYRMPLYITSNQAISYYVIYNFNLFHYLLILLVKLLYEFIHKNVFIRPFVGWGQEHLNAHTSSTHFSQQLAVVWPGAHPTKLTLSRFIVVLDTMISFHLSSINLFSFVDVNSSSIWELIINEFTNLIQQYAPPLVVYEILNCSWSFHIHTYM